MSFTNESIEYVEDRTTHGVSHLSDYLPLLAMCASFANDMPFAIVVYYKDSCYSDCAVLPSVAKIPAQQTLPGLRCVPAPAVSTHNRDVIRLDHPHFHCAELTVGRYDYILTTLPLLVRMLASIAGAHGSTKRGI